MRGKGSVQAFSGGPVSYQPLTTQRTNRSDPWVLREGPGAACQWRCRQRRVDQVHSRDQRGRHPEHAGPGWVGAPGEPTEPRPDQEPSQRRPGTAGKSRGEGKEQRWPGPRNWSAVSCRGMRPGLGPQQAPARASPGCRVLVEPGGDSPLAGPAGRRRPRPAGAQVPAFPGPRGGSASEARPKALDGAASGWVGAQESLQGFGGYGPPCGALTTTPGRHLPALTLRGRRWVLTTPPRPHWSARVGGVEGAGPG